MAFSLAAGRSILRGGLCVGYCAAIAQRDSPVAFSSTLLMRLIKGHARWRWRT